MRLISYEIHDDGTIDAVIALRRWFWPWSWRRAAVWNLSKGARCWRYVETGEFIDVYDTLDFKLNALIDYAQRRDARMGL